MRHAYRVAHVISRCILLEKSHIALLPRRLGAVASGRAERRLSYLRAADCTVYQPRTIVTSYRIV